MTGLRVRGLRSLPCDRAQCHRMFGDFKDACSPTLRSLLHGESPSPCLPPPWPSLSLSRGVGGPEKPHARRTHPPCRVHFSSAFFMLLQMAPKSWSVVQTFKKKSPQSPAPGRGLPAPPGRSPLGSRWTAPRPHRTFASRAAPSHLEEGAGLAVTEAGVATVLQPRLFTSGLVTPASGSRQAPGARVVLGGASRTQMRLCRLALS